MLTVNIDKYYLVCETWDDIPLSVFLTLNEKVNSCPKWYKNILLDIEDDVDINEMFAFQKDVLEILSSIPRSILDKCTFLDVFTVFDTYLKKFVISCLDEIAFEPKMITSFVNDDVHLFLPAFDTDISGKTIPLSHITALELCEATDLHIAGEALPTGQFSYAANVVSILCRKEGERYDEAVSKERARKMKDMPMSFVLEVFWALTACHMYAKENYRNVYQGNRGNGKISPMSDFGWNGKILWLADGVENVEKVNEMNCYEFLRQLSFKIAKNEV